MDVAYNQHARRKNRSTTNVNHLSLAPLTTKLPLHDADALSGAIGSAPPVHNTSYLQGKSAPTTPRLLSRSPPRSASHNRVSSLPAVVAPITKSKSATHLATHPHRHAATTSSTLSPSARRRREEPGVLSRQDRSDSDWLLRAGALISTETRESKGQSWLVSRASSTSLTGVRDVEEEAFQRELARERELISRHASRRGSLGYAEDELPGSSAPGSRFGSRSHSRAETRSHLHTPGERVQMDGYFQHPDSGGGEDYIPGPDFVNLDEKLETVEQDTTQDDEATVRRLVRREKDGSRTWMGSILGWSLFSVNEHDEDSEDDDQADEVDDDETSRTAIFSEEYMERRRSSLRQLDGIAHLPEEHMPPPKADEGGWHDAAWLLSVASKVLL